MDKAIRTCWELNSRCARCGSAIITDGRRIWCLCIDEYPQESGDYNMDRTTKLDKETKR